MNTTCAGFWPWRAQTSVTKQNDSSMTSALECASLESMYGDVVDSDKSTCISSPESVNHQSRKQMAAPTLLRLNSVGEYSSVSHQQGDQSYSYSPSRATGNKTDLHMSRSAPGTLVSPASNQLFSKMATARTFVRPNTSRSGDCYQTPSPLRSYYSSPEPCARWGKARPQHSHSNSFDSSLKTMPTYFTMTRPRGSSFATDGSESLSDGSRSRSSTGSTQYNAGNGIVASASMSLLGTLSTGLGTNGFPPGSLGKGFCHLFPQATCTTNSTQSPRSSHVQPSLCTFNTSHHTATNDVHECSMSAIKDSTNEHVCDSCVHNKSKSLSVTNSMLSPGAIENVSKTSSPESSSSSESSTSSEQSSQSVIFDESSSHSSSANISKDEKRKNSPSSDKPASPPNHHKDLSSVLFTPRKTAKKGRPTSKKQKKRQRQKQKNSSKPSEVQAESHGSITHTQGATNSSSVHESSCSDSVVFELSNSVKDHLSVPLKESTPVKPSKYSAGAVCFLLMTQSDSESDEGDVDDEDSSDWSADESAGACISPIKGGSFNVALNIDSIFKQKKIPSLKSVLGLETDSSASEHSPKNCLRVSLSVSLSDSSHLEDSIEFTPTSPSPISADDCFGLPTGLCIDNLLNKKSTASSKTKSSNSHFSNDFDHHSGDAAASDPFSGECEKMVEVNAKWDKHYPTAGFRSCSSKSADCIHDPSIKVRFAADKSLRTVYDIGNEDRGGIWHHYALDRERFERRVSEASKVISPILDQQHRSQILERNALFEGGTGTSVTVSKDSLDAVKVER